MRKQDKHSTASNKSFLVDFVQRQVMPVPVETVEEAFAKAQAYLKTRGYLIEIEAVLTDDGETIWDEEDCQAVLAERAKAKMRARTTDSILEQTVSQTRGRIDESMNQMFLVDVVRRQTMPIEAERVEESFGKAQAYLRSIAYSTEIEGILSSDGDRIWGEETCLVAS